MYKHIHIYVHMYMYCVEPSSSWAQMIPSQTCIYSFHRSFPSWWYLHMRTHRSRGSHTWWISQELALGVQFIPFGPLLFPGSSHLETHTSTCAHTHGSRSLNRPPGPIASPAAGQDSFCPSDNHPLLQFCT